MTTTSTYIITEFTGYSDEDTPLGVMMYTKTHRNISVTLYYDELMKNYPYDLPHQDYLDPEYMNNKIALKLKKLKTLDSSHDMLEFLFHLYSNLKYSNETKLEYEQKDLSDHVNKVNYKTISDNILLYKATIAEFEKYNPSELKELLIKFLDKASRIILKK